MAGGTRTAEPKIANKASAFLAVVVAKRASDAIRDTGRTGDSEGRGDREGRGDMCVCGDVKVVVCKGEVAIVDWRLDDVAGVVVWSRRGAVSYVHRGSDVSLSKNSFASSLESSLLAVRCNRWAISAPDIPAGN